MLVEPGKVKFLYLFWFISKRTLIKLFVMRLLSWIDSHPYLIDSILQVLWG